MIKDAGSYDHVTILSAIGDNCGWWPESMTPIPSSGKGLIYPDVKILSAIGDSSGW